MLYCLESNLLWDIDLVKNLLSSYTRCVFINYGLPQMTYNAKFRRLGVTKVERDHFVNCLTIFYNVYHKFVAKYFCDFSNSAF